MKEISDAQRELNVPTGTDASPQVHTVDADVGYQNGIIQQVDGGAEMGENSAQLRGSGDGGSGADHEQQPARKRNYHLHTQFQKEELERLFVECPRPSKKQQNDISEKIDLNTKQTKCWFQNRRAQEKSQLERHGNLLIRENNDFLSSPPIPSTMGSTSSILTTPSIDFTIDLSSTVRGLHLGILPSSTTSDNKSVYTKIAIVAMNELMNMACADEPFWGKKIDDPSNPREVLNVEKYGQLRLPSHAREVTRGSGFVVINRRALVELFMNANSWAEAFSGLVGKGAIVDVVSCGVGGTRNGSLQLMRAEFQAISPVIPVHHIKFLRFCKKQTERIWAVVDLSLFSYEDGSSLSTASMRLLSGCVLEDLAHGCCKVTWVENWMYDKNSVKQRVMHSMVNLGTGFGARRWISTLQRYCESIALLATSFNSLQDPSVITIAGKRNLLKLSRRMINLYCGGISVASSSSKWEKREAANVSEDVRIAVRKNSTEPGDTLGVAVSVSTSMWLPVSRKKLFEFLVNDATREDWDVMVSGATIKKLVHLPKARIHGNSVSILRASKYGGSDDPTMMLQEIWNDESSSLLVYTPVNVQSLEMVMNGGDSTFVGLLPSGFAIFPDGNDGVGSFDDGTGASTSTGTVGIDSRGGCIMTVGFQILVSTIPTTRVKRKSLQTANNLLSRTVKRTKDALQIA